MGEQERRYGRSIAAYKTSEVNTRKPWTDGRPIYRIVVDTGALPNATTKSVAHGVTGIDRVTKLRGMATDESNDDLPLPWVHDTTSEVQLWRSGDNIRIRTGVDMSGYTASWVMMEYVK